MQINLQKIPRSMISFVTQSSKSYVSVLKLWTLLQSNSVKLWDQTIDLLLYCLHMHLEDSTLLLFMLSCSIILFPIFIFY